MRLLADVNPDDPDAFEDVRPNLSLPQEGPLSHFRALMVVAESSEGETLGPSSQVPRCGSSAIPASTWRWRTFWRNASR